MNITQGFCCVKTNDIEQPDSIQALNKKINEKLNEKLKNKIGMPVRLIPADMDTRLHFLKGKTNKLRKIIQHTEVYRTALPLNSAITSAPVYTVTKNIPIIAKRVSVSVSRVTAIPPSVIIRTTEDNFPVITQPVTSRVLGTSCQAEEHSIIDMTDMKNMTYRDDAQPTVRERTKLFCYDNQPSMERTQAEKQVDINDVTPVFYIEKSHTEYPVLFTKHANIQAVLQRNIPVSLLPLYQHGMVDEYIKATHYFAYAFKIQGEYNEMVYIYRNQQRNFILETNTERLKRHLKANVRNGQKENIDIV